MAWEMRTDRPIYMQIVERLKMRIVSGVYPPGSKIPSVRDLAAEAGVNPNTMQKALGDLERDGMVHTQRTSGKTVTEDEEMIRTVRTGMAEDETRQYLGKLEGLGLDAQDGVKLVQKVASDTGSKYDIGEL